MSLTLSSLNGLCGLGSLIQRPQVSTIPYAKAYSTKPPIYRILDHSELSELKIAKPPSQRDLVESRVVEIQKYLQQHRGMSVSATPVEGKVESYPILGFIALCHLKTNQEEKYYIIDGQHRLEAIKREHENGNIVKIFVMIYSTDSMQGIEDSFQLINLGVPLADYHRATIGTQVAEAKDLKTADNVTLMRQFEAHIRARPLFCDKFNRPYINVNMFMNLLRESAFINEIKSVEQFSRWLDRCNLHMKSLVTDKYWCKKNKIDTNAPYFFTCQRENNYLPLDTQFAWRNDRRLFCE